VHTDYIMNR